MLLSNILLVVALGVTAFAYPQNGGSFEVDGFVFDGPADRSPFRPVSTARPTTRPAVSTEGPLRAVTTTTTPVPLAQFDTCVNSCRVTPEYNPVCGTDTVLYNNPGALNCAAFCGKAVSLNYYGPCAVTGGVRG